MGYAPGSGFDLGTNRGVHLCEVRSETNFPRSTGEEREPGAKPESTLPLTAGRSRRLTTSGKAVTEIESASKEALKFWQKNRKLPVCTQRKTLANRL
jgi:hypothetical protein